MRHTVRSSTPTIAMSDTRLSIFRLLGRLGIVAAAFAPVAVSAQTAMPPAPASMVVAHPQPPQRQPLVQIDLAVESFASTATGAHAAGDLAARRVVHALTASGLPVQEVRALDSYLIPQYTDPGVVPVNTVRQNRRIVGYRSVNGITVLTADPRHVGLLVDFAQGAGANQVLGVYLPGAAGAGR
jgi:uncharacterized protein YggE